MSNAQNKCEEVPGWQYIDQATWQDLLVRDVKKMIAHNRNHAALVTWGTRAIESANDIELYPRTRAAAKALDDPRPNSDNLLHAKAPS